MEKYTQKFIKSLVKQGDAIDVTNSLSREAIPRDISRSDILKVSTVLTD